MAAPSAYPLGAALTVQELEGDPHPALARLRAAEPVSRVPALGGWLVTRHDLAVEVLRDPCRFTVQDERFTTAQVVGPSMLSLDGRAHDRHRAAFAPGFRPAIVRERFTAEVDRQCAALLDGLAQAGTADLLADFAGPLTAGVLARALGLEVEEVGRLRSWYEAIVAAVTDLTAGRPLPTAGRAAYGALAQRLTETGDAATRATDPTGRDVGRNPMPEPLLATARHAAAGVLIATELLSNAAVLLFGGIETTEAMIANALQMILEDPDVHAAVRPAPRTVDPEMLDQAIDESLRLEPAAAVLDRYATCDLTLGPAAIAAGDLVRVSLAAAGRDPAVFPDPDRCRLDPPRPRRHLAFALGPHVCLGVHLARLEARVALTGALTRLPGLRLDPARYAPVSGLVFRKPRQLFVRWDAST